MSNVIYCAPVLYVKNLDASINFYQTALGFEVEFQYSDHYASIKWDTCVLHLRKVWGSIPERSYRGEDGIDVNIAVKDISLVDRSLQEAKIAPAISLRKMPYGTEIYLRDHDGNLLAFVQPVE